MNENVLLYKKVGRNVEQTRFFKWKLNLELFLVIDWVSLWWKFKKNFAFKALKYFDIKISIESKLFSSSLSLLYRRKSQRKTDFLTKEYTGNDIRQHNHFQLNWFFMIINFISSQKGFWNWMNLSIPDLSMSRFKNWFCWP